jgi:transposase
LAEIQRTAQSVAEFTKARAIALLDAGWSAKDVAEALDVSAQAVYSWRQRFISGGASALRDRPRSGRTRVYGEAFRRVLRHCMSRRPREWGLIFTVWTILSLSTVIYVKTRKWISATHLRRILHDEGYRWRRPRLSLRHRQNRRRYKAVQRELGRLEKGTRRPGADYVLLYGDEAEFHLNPELTGMWARKGVPFDVPSAGQNRRVSAFGAVNYATGHLVWTLADRKNQHEFLRFLKRVLQAYPGRRIVLVLDNVAYHKTAMIQRFFEEHQGRLRVIWLPPYSPQLNRIERIWKHLKSRYVCNEFFGTLAKLKESVELALSETSADLQVVRRLMTYKPRRRRAA